jgi:hypothetical protein
MGINLTFQFMQAFLLLACLSCGVTQAAFAQPNPAGTEGHLSPSLHQLTHSLTSQLQSDQEKITAIFDWITQHIEYDVAGLNSGRHGSQSAEQTLASKRGMCLDFANLFNAMARVAGLNSRVVKGRIPAKNISGTAVNHAWNKVLVDGQVKIVDTAWGAGAVSATEGNFRRERNTRFLMAEPEALRLSHWEADSSDTLPPIKGMTVETFNQVQSNTLHLLDLGFKHNELSRILSNFSEMQLPRAYQALDPGIRIVEAPLHPHAAEPVRRFKLRHSVGTTILILAGNEYHPLEKNGETESAGVIESTLSGHVSICYRLADGSHHMLLKYPGSI